MPRAGTPACRGTSGHTVNVVVQRPRRMRENGHRSLRLCPYGPLWMPHPRRINSMAGTSTPYRPGRPEQRARITSHGSVTGTQQHQEARPGRSAPTPDQVSWPGIPRFGVRTTHRETYDCGRVGLRGSGRLGTGPGVGDVLADAAEPADPALHARWRSARARSRRFARRGGGVTRPHPGGSAARRDAAPVAR